MNITKSLLCLAVAGLFFTSCKQNEAAPESVENKTVAAKPETASFSIEGMTCEVGCAKTNQKELAGLEGVQDATVDFEKKTAVVKFDAAKQTPEKLVETVEAAADGKTYKVSNVKSSGDQAMLYDNEKEKKKEKEQKEKRRCQERLCS